MQVKLIGNSKLPVGVNVSVNGSLSLFELWDELAECPACFPLLTNVSWDQLQSPAGWLDLLKLALSHKKSSGFPDDCQH